MFGAYWKLPPHNAIQETFTQGRGKIRPQRHFPPFEKSSNKNLNFAESKIFISGATLNAIFIRKYFQILQISDIMFCCQNLRGENYSLFPLPKWSDVKTKSLVTLIYYRLGYLCNKTHGTVNEVFICTDYRYAIFVWNMLAQL